MTINGMNTMNQISQMQQGGSMQKGNGNGMHGMKNIMQNLTPDQRQEISQSMQNLSQTDRKNVMEQLKQIDASKLDNQQYFQALQDTIKEAVQSSNQIAASGFNMYA